MAISPASHILTPLRAWCTIQNLKHVNFWKKDANASPRITNDEPVAYLVLWTWIFLYKSRSSSSSQQNVRWRNNFLPVASKKSVRTRRWTDRIAPTEKPFLGSHQAHTAKQQWDSQGPFLLKLIVRMATAAVARLLPTRSLGNRSKIST